MITIHWDIEQGTEEWLKLREDLYTGSGADKLLAHSGQIKVVEGVASPYAVADITGFKGNFYTKRGHLLEEQAVDLYEKITKSTVARPGFVTNSTFPTCGYSPDGCIIDEVVIDENTSVIIKKTLEVKAFKEDLHLKLLAGDIPARIMAQLQFGMLICGAKSCDFIPYNANFAKKRLLIDDEFQDNPNYDPSKALKIISVKYNPSIAQNFRRKLKSQPMMTK